MNMHSATPVTPAGVTLLHAVHVVRHGSTTQTDLLRVDDFTLKSGDRVAVSGPSGSGKSVFLRTLALLDPLDAGQILYRGKSIADAAIPTYRRHVAYIAQRPAMVDGSVEDNLRYPFSLKAYCEDRFDLERVMRLANHAGRGTDFLKKSATDLSGGEAQIAALIRVLQLAPDVLLLDEPTASLDPDSALEVEALISGWFDGADSPSAGAPSTRASVWVSHNPEQARRVGNRHLTMRAGNLTETPAP
jgi:putative ABC transport system ATP-binding protein